MKVTIYVEGGGDNEDTITRCRQGFAAYCSNAGSGKHQPRVVPCGGRQKTFDRFQNAVRAGKQGDRYVLLVDSEGAVKETNAIDHLAARDGWIFPDLGRSQVFLMVQAMEAWFLADRETLAAFYGEGFLANGLPRNPNIEEIRKDDLEPALKRASKPTKTKGEYHKVKHGFVLLGFINPVKVEKASKYAKKFNDFLRSL